MITHKRVSWQRWILPLNHKRLYFVPNRLYLLIGYVKSAYSIIYQTKNLEKLIVGVCGSRVGRDGDGVAG